MSRIRRISPGLGRGGLLGNTEGPEFYLRELDTLPSQFCRATGGTETVISQGGKFYRVHTFTDTDPTSLLLNFDASNGSTTFTDDSGWGHAVTANGNAAISTAQSKFGGSSLALDGLDGTYASLSANSLFTFGTEPFTVEAWVRPVSTESVDCIVCVGTAASASNWQLIFEDTSSTQTRITWGNVGGDFVTSSGYIQMNEWSHVAAVGNGSEVKLFINGQQDGTLSLSYNLSDAAVLKIGTNRSNNRWWNGYIDSLRITKGQALYTAAFTPPTTALTRVGSGSLTFTRGGAVEYLVVGGGGGGSSVDTLTGRGSGGGGAGGFRSGTTVAAAAQSFVSVGGEGSGGFDTPGESGSSSSWLLIHAAGGGGGGGGGGGAEGLNGGSGGGGYSGNSPGTEGGSGNTPAVSPSQGNDGGLGISSGGNGGGGGGGGASAVGADAVISPSSAGDGGDGTASSISGSSVTYAGGGGGGSGSSTGGGTGGSGGGGSGGNTSSKNGTSGTANTGSGGGGASSLSNVYGTGGSGGSGIVIARYRITPAEYFQGLDPDAAAYIQAVEAADGQKLENSVVLAIDSFVQTLKSDGNWDAIKASCILCGARTLAGALVPLKGAAPTNYNFVGLGTDYSRTAGLTGDGSTKYLDSGRDNDDDPQNNQHLAVYAYAAATDSTSIYIGDSSFDTAGACQIGQNTVAGTLFARNRNVSADIASDAAITNLSDGFIAISRDNGSSFILRASSVSETFSRASQTPSAGSIHVFARGLASPSYSNSTLAFYSIGEAVDLALLDTAVSTLVSEIGAAV